MFILCMFVFSCLLVKNNSSIDRTQFLFPSMEFPDGNEFTEARYELGKKLFFDPILSIDSTLSCASCHKPERAFSDEVAFSPGVFSRAGVRNAPSLGNVGYQPYFLREGSVPTLEMQVLIPIQEKNEFAHNIVEIAKQIQTDSSYVKLSRKAYNRMPDHFVITRALGVFERTLISKNSKFDRYIQHNTKLSRQELLGFNLFMSEKTNCSSCHGGFNFTKYAITNNGLYENYKDVGKMRATHDSSDMALFKVPSLRNVEVTAPYMHDGSYSTLEEVIAHYNSGGKNHVNKSPLIKPLSLSIKEQEALVSFLKTLTDTSFNNLP